MAPQQAASLVEQAKEELKVSSIESVKVIVDGTPRHAYACTRCLRSGKVTRAI